MGGDGGCVANNRRYMRGAGLPTGSAKDKDTVSAAERERLYLGMTTCALSGRSLFECSSSSGVVSCPYGKMYCRESAIQALLHRRRPRDHVQQVEEPHWNHDLGFHIRGMKDLFPVRLHFTSSSSSSSSSTTCRVPSCPITGIQLNGSVPAFLIVHSKKNKIVNNSSTNVDEEYPNVLSEKGIKEMGMDGLQTEYGPFDAEDMIRLVPPMGPIFDSIQEKWTDKCLAEEAMNNNNSNNNTKQQVKGDGKKKHKKDKDNEDVYKDHDEADDDDLEGKRKRHKDIDTTYSLRTKSETMGEEIRKDNKRRNESQIVSLIHTTTAASQAREYVSSTVASNPILSSLFTQKK